MLDDQGYRYREDKSAGSVQTEPKLLVSPNDASPSDTVYHSRLFLTISNNSVTVNVKFDKNSPLLKEPVQVEDPAGENTLRRNFFNDMDSVLRTLETRVSDTPKALPHPTPAVTEATPVKAKIAVSFGNIRISPSPKARIITVLPKSCNHDFDQARKELLLCTFDQFITDVRFIHFKALHFFGNTCAALRY